MTASEQQEAIEQTTHTLEMIVAGVEVLKNFRAAGKGVKELSQTFDEFANAQQILQIISGLDKAGRLRVLDLAVVAAKNDETDDVWPVEAHANLMLQNVVPPAEQWSGWLKPSTDQQLNDAIDAYEEVIAFFEESLRANRPVLVVGNRNCQVQGEMVACHTKVPRGYRLTGVIWSYALRFFKMLMWNKAKPDDQRTEWWTY